MGMSKLPTKMVMLMSNSLGFVRAFFVEAFLIVIFFIAIQLCKKNLQHFKQYFSIAISFARVASNLNYAIMLANFESPFFLLCQKFGIAWEPHASTSKP